MPRLTALKSAALTVRQRVSAFLHWHYRLLLRLLLGVGLVLLTAALGWQFYVLPRLNDFRPLLQARFHASTGGYLDFSQLSGGWHGMQPSFRVEHLVVSNRDHVPALKLDALDAEVSWLSLAAWQLRFARLQLQAPALDVLRDAQGVWHVAGFTVEPRAGGGDNTQLNWLLNQREVDINGGSVRYQDLLSGAPVFEAHDLHLQIKSLFGRHRFNLAASPATNLARTLSAPAVGMAATWPTGVIGPARCSWRCRALIWARCGPCCRPMSARFRNWQAPRKARPSSALAMARCRMPTWICRCSGYWPVTVAARCRCRPLMAVCAGTNKIAIKRCALMAAN